MLRISYSDHARLQAYAAEAVRTEEQEANRLKLESMSQHLTQMQTEKENALAAAGSAQREAACAHTLFSPSSDSPRFSQPLITA